MFNPQAVQQYVDAFRGDPEPLMREYAVSQKLVALIALQQINQEKMDAARQMRLQMAQARGQQPPTVAEQLERETLDLTQQEMAQKLAPLAQAQAQQQMQGIAANPAPNISQQGFAQGGIVGFQSGGPTNKSPEREPGESFEDFRKRLFKWELEQGQRERTATAEARRLKDLERQQMLAERGGELIPPSPFFDRKPLDLYPTPTGVASAADRTMLNKAEAAARRPTMSFTGPIAGPQLAAVLADVQQRFGDSAAKDFLAEYQSKYGGVTTPATQPTTRTAEMRPADAVEERGTGGLDVPEERMPARAASGLEALYEKQLTEGVAAAPDYSQLEEYRKAIIDPTKDIQRQRQAALQQRQQEAAQMRDKQLAAMQDDTPGWLRYLQHATASIGTGPSAGLRALSAGAVSKRKEDESRALKQAEVEQKYMDLVNQLTDAGFGVQEAMIKAEDLMFGKKTEADKTAAERRKSALTEAGQEVRNRRSADATVQAARISAAARTEGTSAYDKAVEKAEQAFSRNPRAKVLFEELKSPLTSLDPKVRQQKMAELEAIRANIYTQFGIRIAEPAPQAAPPANTAGFKVFRE